MIVLDVILTETFLKKKGSQYAYCCNVVDVAGQSRLSSLDRAGDGVLYELC